MLSEVVSGNWDELQVYPSLETIGFREFYFSWAQCYILLHYSLQRAKLGIGVSLSGMIWKTLFIPCQRADCLKLRVSMCVAGVGYIRVPCGVKQVPCSIERKEFCLQGVCVCLM